MPSSDQLNRSISQGFDGLLTNLTKEQYDPKPIENQFLELFQQITDVEEISYPHFVEYRRRYHLIHVAFYKSIQDDDKVQREERLLHRYESLHNQYSIAEAFIETNPTPNEEVSDDYETSWETICDLVTSLNQLDDTDQMLNKLKYIRGQLQPLFQRQIRTLDEYNFLQNRCKHIVSLLETSKVNEFDLILDIIDNTDSNYLDLLTETIDYVSKGLEDRQTHFANILLADLPRLDKILFENIPPTELCIKQRYREWARLFHSDKHQANPVFDELMKEINCIRDRLLSKIHAQSYSSDIVKTEQEAGHRHARSSIEFKKRLTSGGDVELNVEDLKKLVSFEALTAFQHYRVALKCLGRTDHEETIMTRAQILEWMALMMRQTGNHDTEAQLYIVAAIYIITLSNMTDRSYKKLHSLQSALEKYQGIEKNNVSEVNTATSTNTNRELVLCTNSRLSPREIHDETQVFLRETILRKCVVRSTQPKELNTDSKPSEVSFQTHTEGYQRVLSVVGGIFSRTGGDLLISGCSWALNRFVFSEKKNKPSMGDLSSDYNIRCKLNTLFGEAIVFYNDEKYDEFLKKLSESYYEDRRLMDTKFGRETISIEIRVDQIIGPLLKYGFRADKIAHLLILIGEVLLRGIDFKDPQRSNPVHSSLLEQSKILFQGVYDNEALDQAAVKLDKRVEEYYHGRIRKIVRRILNPISETDIKDSREAPYADRLASYCRLARLNYAIACLLAGGKDNFELCKKSLKNLKLSECTYDDRFFAIPDERIQALEDLLSAFGMDEDDRFNRTNSTNMLAITEDVPIDIENIEYFKSLLGYQACKIVEKVNDDNQLTMLAHLIRTEHDFDCEAFIRFLLEKYSNTDQLILELLRQQRVSNLSEWAMKFRLNSKVFQHQAYLPLLSAFGHMKIQPCKVVSDKEYGIVFAPSHSVIDYTLGNNEAHNLYVVVLPGQDHISGVFTLVSIEISHLHWGLKDLPDNHPQRAGILLRIATHYEEEARQNDKQSHLAALIEWRKAQTYYAQVLSMKDFVTKEYLDSAESGFCRCLLKQHRYSRINERLSARERIHSSDLWLIYAQAQRNMGDYESAQYGIQQAIKLESSHKVTVDVRREERMIRMKQERIEICEPLDLSSCSSMRNDQQPFLNILSIDGGGVRGVLPAIWLMVLENKIKQPISSIFHVVAGTSTGAILAAGLTTPSLKNPSKPGYQASDLVQLYRTKTPEVFLKNAGFFNELRASFLKEPKYIDDGRHKIFYEYFRGSKISDTISELVIPAVKSGSDATDLFTRHASRQDVTQNFLLTEILMCSSAAPTYFPAYKLKNTVYLDGGVQANNPSMLAYDHTLRIHRNCNRERIRLVSLGTGDFVLDPLDPEASRNLLFWAQNNQSVLKVLMDGPQNNIDLHLNGILGQNYYRWQVWLEDAIQLDDTREESINRLIDLAHGHIEEMEAYDNRQRLGRLIEDLQSNS